MAHERDLFGGITPINPAVSRVGERVESLLSLDPSLADDDWRLVVAYWRRYCHMDDHVGPEAVKCFLDFVSRVDVPGFNTIARRRRERRHRFRASPEIERYRQEKGRQWPQGAK